MIRKNDMIETLVPKHYIIPRRGRLGDNRCLPVKTQAVVVSADANTATISNGNGTLTYKHDQVRLITHGCYGWRPNGTFGWMATKD